MIQKNPQPSYAEPTKLEYGGQAALTLSLAEAFPTHPATAREYGIRRGRVVGIATVAAMGWFRP